MRNGGYGGEIKICVAQIPSAIPFVSIRISFPIVSCRVSMSQNRCGSSIEMFGCRTLVICQKHHFSSHRSDSWEADKPHLPPVRPFRLVTEWPQQSYPIFFDKQLLTPPTHFCACNQPTATKSLQWLMSPSDRYRIFYLSKIAYFLGSSKLFGFIHILEGFFSDFQVTCASKVISERLTHNFLSSTLKLIFEENNFSLTYLFNPIQ